MDSFWHCESHHWNKTSVDYLNTVGRGGREGQCWSMMVGLCKRDSGKRNLLGGWVGRRGGEGRGLKNTCNFFCKYYVTFLFRFFLYWVLLVSLVLQVFCEPSSVTSEAGEFFFFSRSQGERVLSFVSSPVSVVSSHVLLVYRDIWDSKALQVCTADHLTKLDVFYSWGCSHVLVVKSLWANNKKKYLWHKCVLCCHFYEP